MSSDILVMEQHKENIQSLPGGRSVAKLASVLKNSSKLALQLKESLKTERDQYEAELCTVDELDDPLQVFVEYINWVHMNYPQGTNNESGLLSLLERCTSYFRDVLHYKNDSRYLKVWLEYANYSDAPRDIFVYLAKKEIGNQLALYYEEFAQYLEVTGKLIDACQIYELGIESQARPLVRLRRSFTTFKERTQSTTTKEFAPIIRNALALKRGDSAVPMKDDPVLKKQKVNVFKDDTEQNQSVLYSIFNAATDGNDLGTIKSRIKENVVSSKPWAGEVFKQKVPETSAPTSAKFTVFRDDPEGPMEPPKAIQSTEEDKNGIYTLIKNPGKRTEKVHLNVDLLYPSPKQEFCLLELLILSRKGPTENGTVRDRDNRDNRDNKENAIVGLKGETSRLIDENTRIVDADLSTQQDFQEVENHHDVLVPPAFESTHTFTIPLADEEPRRPRSPTLTMFSRMVNHEVINMFNDAAQDLNSEDEVDRQNDTATSNYDGFITETIHADKDITPSLAPIATPPTDREDNHSSPFVERPSFESDPLLVNPVAPETIDRLLSELPIPVSLYPGYSEMPDITASRLLKFKEITSKQTKLVPKGSLSAMIDFCGDEIYCLRQELGVGGFGVVYLVETSSSGDLRAMKIESPGSKWEFYILNQVHRRIIERATSRLFVKPQSFYHFRDESYLLMEYCPQGTILDVVNYFKNERSQNVDECLTIFLTIELIKSIEALHSIGILHGDLKADNCMIRFEQLNDSEELGETYETLLRSPWRKKSTTLIDFGRAIDLRLFPNNVQFVCDWKTDQQDCPQMRENKPWSFEADYYGLACIIHTLLYGCYIKTKTGNNIIKMEATLKRYWQADLWGPLFDLLLNPYDVNETALKKPILTDLKAQRIRLENWLIHNSRSKNLRSIIIRLENDLNLASKRRLD